MKRLWVQNESEILIPQVLKEIGLFCLTKNKIPYSLDGNEAKTNNPSSFDSFDKISRVFEEKQDEFDGLGIGLFDTSTGFHLCAIDIDHCVNPNTEEMAPIVHEIISELNSYSELSPSKTGVHILFASTEIWDTQKYYQNRRRVIDENGEIITFQGQEIGLEIYNSGNTRKYLRISGKHISSSPFNVFRRNINSLLEKYMRKQVFIKTQGDEETPIFQGGVQDWCLKDPKLETLYYDTNHEVDNESEHDISLCCKLAFWTGKNEKEIDKLFRVSSWYLSKDEYHKKKWEREDYRNETISKSLNMVTYNKPKPQQRSYTLDDTGNAHRFIDSFGDDIRYNIDNNSWMIWNGNFWQTDIANKVRSFVEEMTKVMSDEALNFYNQNIKGVENEKLVKENKARYKDMLKNISYLRSKRGKDNCLSESEHIENIPVTNSIFDTSKNKLCTLSGTVDLKTGSINPNKKEDYFTRCVPFMIDKGTPEKFESFLKSILKKHPETLDYVKRLFGYAITGETMEQKIFFLYGDGNDGKSVLMNTICEVLDEYSGNVKKDLIVDGGVFSNSQDNSLARIKGKRLVTIDEMSGKDKLNEGLVKAITSGTGEITARYLYANEFTYKFTAKIIVTTNYEPRITGVDRGIWRRIIVLPFDLGLKDSEVDRTLKDKLKLEAARILWWLIEGAVQYYQKGLSDVPQCSLDMTKEYREENDEVQQWLDENTVSTADDDSWTASSDLYEDFYKWCKKGNQYVLSQTLWGKSMRKKFKKARVNNQTIYYGVRIYKNSINNKTALKARAMMEEIDDENI